MRRLRRVPRTAVVVGRPRVACRAWSRSEHQFPTFSFLAIAETVNSRLRSSPTFWLVRTVHERQKRSTNSLTCDVKRSWNESNFGWFLRRRLPSMIDNAARGSVFEPTPLSPSTNTDAIPVSLNIEHYPQANRSSLTGNAPVHDRSSSIRSTSALRVCHPRILNKLVARFQVNRIITHRLRSCEIRFFPIVPILALVILPIETEANAGQEKTDPFRGRSGRSRRGNEAQRLRVPRPQRADADSLSAISPPGPKDDDQLPLHPLFQKSTIPISLNLNSCESITDAGLAHLKDIRPLRAIRSAERVTNDGLKHLMI